MNTRVFSISALVALALVLVIGWFAVVAPQRTDASSTSAQITSAQQELQLLEAQTASGGASKKTVRKARLDLRRLGEALPRSYAEPGLIDRLQVEARDSHVDFQTISFTAAAPAPAAVTPAATTATATAPTTTPAATTPTTASTTTQAAVPLGFTLTVAGRYFNVTRFIADLQNMTGATSKRIWVAGRLLSFTGVTLTAAKSAAGTMNATLTGNAYLLPASSRTAGAA